MKKLLLLAALVVTGSIYCMLPEESEEAGEARVRLEELNTKLLRAAYLGRLDQVQDLLHKGASVNAVAERGGDTPLHAAATVNADNIEVAKYLLSKGANINTTNSAGRTPLQSAIKRDNTKIAQFLKDHGAK